MLAERFARQRLNALVRVEGRITDAKPTVLFLCTHNAGRSQMALGFFTHPTVTKPSHGPAIANPAMKSIPPRCKPWPKWASKSWLCQRYWAPL